MCPKLVTCLQHRRQAWPAVHAPATSHSQPRRPCQPRHHPWQPLQTGASAIAHSQRHLLLAASCCWLGLKDATGSDPRPRVQDFRVCSVLALLSPGCCDSRQVIAGHATAAESLHTMEALRELRASMQLQLQLVPGAAAAHTSGGSYLAAARPLRPALAMPLPVRTGALQQHAAGDAPVCAAPARTSVGSYLAAADPLRPALPLPLPLPLPGGPSSSPSSSLVTSSGMTLPPRLDPPLAPAGLPATTPLLGEPPLPACVLQPQAIHEISSLGLRSWCQAACPAHSLAQSLLGDDPLPAPAEG